MKGYENGSRKPDLQTLQIIASHYNKPIDELLYTDLTDFGEMDLDLNSISGMVDLLNVMIPLYCSESAMKNNNLYWFIDVDDPDLKLILDAFGIEIPAKLYRRAELKRIKTSIKVFM